MMRKRFVVRFEEEELSYLIDFLVTGLRVWSEKGFESIGEEEVFHRIVSIVGKLREVNGEKEVIFI